jgi:hypothetical protein
MAKRVNRFAHAEQLMRHAANRLDHSIRKGKAGHHESAADLWTQMCRTVGILQSGDPDEQVLDNLLAYTATALAAASRKNALSLKNELRKVRRALGVAYTYAGVYYR